VATSSELETQACQVIAGQVKWNLEREVDGYVAGDALEFSVHAAAAGRGWDHHPVGVATLRSEQFFPYGFGALGNFGAQLTLRSAGAGIAGLLHVRVDVLMETPAPLASQLPLDPTPFSREQIWETPDTPAVVSPPLQERWRPPDSSLYTRNESSFIPPPLLETGRPPRQRYPAAEPSGQNGGVWEASFIPPPLLEPGRPPGRRYDTSVGWNAPIATGRIARNYSIGYNY